MDIFGGLRKLLGLDNQQAQPQRKVYEDETNVFTPQGTRPLNTVHEGEPWQNIQTGFSPNGYQSPLLSSNPAIRGSINPIGQVQRGNTPYSPGEGPRTNFPDFAEILKRFR